MKFIAASIATLALIGTAHAADLPIHKPAPAPVASAACLENNGLATDVFGFNTGSDVNDVGALSGALTYGGSFGARNGSADGHLLTGQLSYGAYPCLEIGPYLFAGAANSKAYGFNALHGSQYGAGIEIKYKFLGRDTHGVGATFDLALQGAALNGALYGPPGFRSDSSWDAVYSIFLDKELIAGKLYGAINIGMDSNWTDMPQLFKSSYARASTLRIGASLAYQVIDGVFISAELDHFRRYDNVFFGDELGYATYAGPGVYWQATKDLALSAAWDIQISGKAKGVPGNLDLTDFSQHIVKAKLAYSF